MSLWIWIKALHVAAAVTFVAGLLLLSLVLRLVDTAPAPQLPQERRLVLALRSWDRLVTAPALGLVWLLGLGLAMHFGWFREPWLMAKMLLVLLLSALHGMQSGRLRRLLGATAPARSAVQRWVGPVVVGSTVLIVLLVVAKPPW